jgi:glycosyltransferase involved in cell wall biosynthesis
MRIVHVITRLVLGGAQENTVLTCEDLLRIHGDEVLLVTGPPVGPEGSLLARTQRSGVPVEVAPALRREIHPWRDSRSYAQIRGAIRRFAPDVVHTHSGKAGLLGRLAAHRLGVPAIVHTVHGAPFHPYQSRGASAVFRWCERYAASRCDVLVSVADAMTDLLVRAGVAPRAKFITVYSGMEVEPFLRSDELRAAARARLGYRDDHVVVGKIARLFHLKGHADVVRAAEQVVRENANVRFLFVGDGLLAGEIRAQVERAGLGEYLQFTGLVPPEEIPALISAMDIVVHASLREGLARVLPQGLISGKPVISYDIDGAREVVITGETGLLLPPRDVDALAAGLVRLAADPIARAQLGAQGRRRFTDQFRHEQMTSQLRTIYERILESKRRG